MRFDKLTRDPEPVDWLERRQAVRDGLAVIAKAKAEASQGELTVERAYSELLALPGIAEAAI